MNDKTELDRARAVQARGLLDNALFKEAFEAIEDGYVRLWKDHAKTPDERERVHIALKTLAKVREHLEVVIQEGKIADRKIAEVTRPKPRFTI